MFLKIISLLLMILIIPSIYADSNGIWIDAKDIRVGTFGSDESGGDYTFPNNLDVLNDIRGNQIFMNGNLVGTQDWVLSKNYASKSWVNANDDVGDPSSTNELQNIDEVLNQGNNAAGNRINNIASANSNDDAASWGQIKNYVNSNDDVGDPSSTNELQSIYSVLNQGNWAGDRIRGVSNPLYGRDAANKRYVDQEISNAAGASEGSCTWRSKSGGWKSKVVCRDGEYMKGMSRLVGNKHKRREKALCCKLQ